MNLYKVYGRPHTSADGGQFGITLSYTIYADKEQEAIDIADKDGELLGKPSEWRVELIIPSKGIFSKDEWEF
jgi:hypothetical protein